MSQLLLVLAVGLTVGAVVFGAAVLISGDDRGLRPVEPDGRSVPLPADRPLRESDLARVRFDVVVRGYRMDQVDAAIARASYDLGYKAELIKVLQAEVAALREGRKADAEVYRRAREAALPPPGQRASGVATPDPFAEPGPFVEPDPLTGLAGADELAGPDELAGSGGLAAAGDPVEQDAPAEPAELGEPGGSPR